MDDMIKTAKKLAESIARTGKFARRFASDPLSIGSIAPSSRWLAARMAAELDGCSRILELGSGCGAITSALLGIPGLEELRASEIDGAMVAEFSRRHPEVRIDAVCASEAIAHACLDWTGRHWGMASSIPFRAIPSDVAETLSAAMRTALLQGGAEIMAQYSYAPIEPFVPGDGLEWTLASVEFRNAPPAFVWLLQRECSEPLPEAMPV